MKKLLIRFLLLIFVVINLSFTVSAQEDVCCYSGNIQYSPTDTLCENSGGVVLGDIDASAGSGGVCSDFEDERASLEVKTSGTIISTIGGNNIYDITKVLEFLEDEEELDMDRYNIIPYDGSGGDGSGDIGSGSGGDTSTGDDDSFDYGDYETPEEIGDEYDDLPSTCAQLGGGLFGFFNEKQTCENVKFSDAVDETACIFNPYRGGKFSSDLSYDYEDSLSEFEEPACVPKQQIRYCGDYKTQQNCEANAAFGEDETFTSKSVALKDGCSWVSADEYMSEYDNQATGMCISKSIDEDSNYRAEEYNQRLNLIKNPSFRKNDDGNPLNWELHGATTYDMGFDSDGEAIKLERGDSIKQTIENMGSSTQSYRPKLYIKKFSEEDIEDSIKITLTQKLHNGSVKEKSIQNPVVTPNVERNGVYGEIIYGAQRITGDTKRLNFTITANSNISVDMVSLESSSAESLSNDPDESSFVPVYLIPENASSCSECFDPLGLNTCTKNKSDGLGMCSYMVSGPDKKYKSELDDDYTGDEDNPRHNKWESQSIASSKVFCESYITEETCTNDNNAVNQKYSSLHSIRGDNLCKWDDDIGCFKDSNDDDKPDVLGGVIKSPNMTEDEEINFGGDIKSNYDHSNSDGKASDFQRACDTIPPLAYTYIVAKNQSGDKITIESNSYDELIGNVSVIVDVKDYFPNDFACADFQEDIEPETNIVFFYEDSSTLTTVEQYSRNQYELKEAFSSGTTEFGIQIFDQSGNVGVNESIELEDVDLSSPGINPQFDVNFYPPSDSSAPSGEEITGLSSEDGLFVSGDFFTQNSTLEFKLEDDKGGMGSCTYNFEDEQGVSIDTDKNTTEFSGEKEEELKINLSEYIDVPSTGTNIELNLQCSDIFGQKTEQRYRINIAGDILLRTPEEIPFDTQNYSSSDLDYVEKGFHNTQQQYLEAYFSRNDISSCEVSTQDDNYNMNIETGEYQFGNNDEGEYSTNVSGNFEFSQQNSEQTIELICTTEDGTTISNSFSYFYEEELPLLDSYELQDRGNTTYYDEQTNQWYTINEPKDTPIDFKLDGTESWIYDNYWLYASNGDNITEEGRTYNSLQHHGYDNEHNFISNATINSIGLNAADPKGNTGRFEDEDAFEYNFSIQLQDKPGNKNNQSFSYIYDNTTPQIQFTGDIITQDNQDNILYTSHHDPQITVGFNTLDYRVYNCNIEINDQDNGDTYREGFTNDNNYSLRFSDILDSSVNLSEDDIRITANCEDALYNDSQEPENSGEQYSFTFDNTPPELNDLYLKNGNTRYFKKNENLEIDAIEDELVFDFNNTGEDGYNCSYTVESVNNNYACKDDTFKQDFDAGTQKEAGIDLLTGYDGVEENKVNKDYTCYQRKQNPFWSGYKSSDGEYETTIQIEAVCEDNVGFKTNNVTTNVDVIYADAGIEDIEFNYSQGKAKPIITMINLPQNQDELSYQFVRQNGEPIFQGSGERESFEGYSEITFGERGIDTTQFIGDTLELTLNVSSGDSIFDQKDVTLYLDHTPPNVNISILDNIDNQIDSDKFKIDFSAEDFGPSNLEEINLYVENQEGEREKIYSKSQGGKDSHQTQPPQILKNTREEFEGDFFFDASTNGEYTFEIEAIDGSGNKNSKNITTEIQNNLRLNFVDTQTTKVSTNPYTLLTRNSGEDGSIDIAMSVSPESVCTIYPYQENDFTGSENSKTFPQNNLFEFDLAEEFPEFSLNDASNNVAKLYIECEQEDGSEQQFIRELQLFEGIPDYSLTSDEGFYFNGELPEHYATTLNIQSTSPVNEMSCEYSYPEENNGSFELGGDEHTMGVEFDPQNSNSNNEQEFTLQCQDSFGVEGPEKTYDFIVSEENAQIGDITLKDGNGNSQIILEDNSQDPLYVAPNTSYNIEFETNKQEAACRYNIGSGGFIENFIEIGLGIFGMTSYSTLEQTDTPFIYEIEEIEFEEDDGEIKIECGFDTKEIELVYVEKSTGSISLN